MKGLLPWTLGALFGAGAAVLAVGAIAEALEAGRARECDALGRTMLGKQAYTCQRMSEGAGHGN